MQWKIGGDELWVKPREPEPLGYRALTLAYTRVELASSFSIEVRISTQKISSPFFWQLVKFFASLKLAVVVILGLAGVTAWGTIVEAMYGEAQAAQKIVYHSVWMYGLLGLLCLSLTAVMIDRWPWQKKHMGFVFAHIGIITLIAGSVLTRYWGVDGSLSIEIGDANRYVLVTETDFTVYTSLNGDEYRKIFDREVDFFSHPPTPAKPFEVSLPDAKLEVVDYLPYALREQKVVASSGQSDGAAVRFQLQNANFNMTEWLLQGVRGKEAIKDLGPARIIIADGEVSVVGQNAVILRPLPDGESLEYLLVSRKDSNSDKNKAKIKVHSEVARKGIVKAGDVIATPWMGMVMRVLKFIPHAKEETLFHGQDSFTEMTTQAIKIRFNGQEQWTSMNSLLKLFAETTGYIVTFANRRLDLAQAIGKPDFAIRLNKFEVGRYQGTVRAASYQSLVTVPGVGETTISMNEPLNYGGFTFYQASFSSDDQGRPVVSVLSVNKDPGRWVKYLGSLLIVLGTIHLFYFKKRVAPKKTIATEVAA